jgi:hypothetical protein
LAAKDVIWEWEVGVLGQAIEVMDLALLALNCSAELVHFIGRLKSTNGA